MRPAEKYQSVMPPKQREGLRIWLRKEMNRCWDIFSRPILAARGDPTKEDLVLQDAGIRYAHQRYHQLAAHLHEVGRIDFRQAVADRLTLLAELPIAKVANA